MTKKAVPSVRKIQFTIGKKYYGKNLAMFRTVDVSMRDHQLNSIMYGKDDVFCDSNVLVGGYMVAGIYTRKEAQELFEQFGKEYGITGESDQ